MNIINLGILAHIDAGKTSVTENLLFACGATEKRGSVDKGDTITDSMDIEKRRGITYNPQIQISAESETKRSIFREKDKTKRSKKESAQHSKSRNKSFVMTSVSAL